MGGRLHVRFEDEGEAAYWATRLSAYDPRDYQSAAAPECYVEERPRRPDLIVVPRDAHVRLYNGRKAVGIYCGHSRSIEDGFRVRYRGGYAEVLCPHSQQWEPLG